METGMGRLTTHVLDTARGAPGAGMRIDLFAEVEDEDELELVASKITNEDGRCDEPLLEGDEMIPGVYELVFHAGAYFRDEEIELPDPPFVDEVILRFGIAEEDGHYHVPLLVSPWSYTTYRGS